MVIGIWQREGYYSPRIEEIWHAINQRRHRVGLPRALELVLEDGHFVVVLEDGRGLIYERWEQCFQVLRATREEAAHLQRWLTDPETYLCEEECQRFKKWLKGMLKGQGEGLVKDLRFEILRPPQEESEVEWVRRAWIEKYRVPQIDWLDEEPPPSFQPSLSCLDNQEVVGGYGVVGTPAHLATLEDRQGQVYARAVFYRTRDGHCYYSLVYALRFGEEETWLTQRLENRLRQELDRFASPLSCPLEDIEPAVIVRASYRCSPSRSGAALIAPHLPYLDAPSNQIKALGFLQESADVFRVCPLVQAEWIAPLWSANMPTPLTREDRQRLQAAVSQPNPVVAVSRLMNHLENRWSNLLLDLPPQTQLDTRQILRYDSLYDVYRNFQNSLELA